MSAGTAAAARRLGVAAGRRVSICPSRAFEAVPEREVVDAAAFERGQRDRGEERQRLDRERQREQIDLAHLLPVGGVQEDRAADQQRADHRLPERREVRAAAARRRPWRCARTAGRP